MSRTAKVKIKCKSSQIHRKRLEKLDRVKLVSLGHVCPHHWGKHTLAQHKLLNPPPDRPAQLAGVKQTVVKSQPSSAARAAAQPFSYMVAPGVFHAAVTLP